MSFVQTITRANDKDRISENKCITQLQKMFTGIWAYNLLKHYGVVPNVVN